MTFELQIGRESQYLLFGEMGGLCRHLGLLHLQLHPGLHLLLALPPWRSQDQKGALHQERRKDYRSGLDRLNKKESKEKDD